MPPERGQVLADRYQLGDVIGRGGMAEVHLGRDLRLGRNVAIKLLRSDLSQDPAFEGRFRREAQSAASLNSPSIVAVYDTGEGEIDGKVTPYIIMEYVKGQTLRDLLAAEGRLLPQRALEITAAVCTALEQAHAAGIVHRDIKPGNVMLTPTGEVKVMDFGIARALATSTATMTQTAAVVGTAHYLSPEQARGEHVDARSDIYSTGCLLYELLTGAPPFTGETAVAVAYQHVREDPTPPSMIEPDIPASIDAIVLVAMSKNPVNRYSTAADMRADVERAMAGKPVHATPVMGNNDPVIPTVSPTTVLMREPPIRRRGLAYLLVGVSALAVFVVALVVVSNLLSGTTKDLSTPNVKQMSLDDAKTTLLSQGLRVGQIAYHYTGKNNKGEVIGQTPAAGLFLHKGLAVDLVVSEGVKLLQVPDNLVGQDLSGAKAVLVSQGFKLGAVIPRNSSAPTNQVLKVKEAGQVLPAGSKIDLVVSNAHVRVPDVTGDDPATASQILIQHGFNPIIRTAAVFTHKNDGLIVTQTPAGTTYAASGSTVYIYVDKKPKPPPTPTNTPSGNPTDTPTGTPTTSSTPKH